VSADRHAAVKVLPPPPQVTHLFRDVLHGWGRVLLSVSVSPSACDYDETSHVLKVGGEATALVACQHNRHWQESCQ
jgi:hypothetical protein